MGKAVTKAVIPAAGLGTRFLPATKAMPKEMLPVVDRPAIQYVVEEAVNAGLTDLLMITGRNKRALEDHFDREPGLERALELKGDTDRLAAVEHASQLGPIHYVRQGEAKGLGHAVLCASQHVGNEPFAVLLGDDLIDENENLLSTMMEVQQKTGGSVIALIEVDPSQISAYGCADITAIDGEDYVRVNSLVEKPAPGTAPSNLAVIGRYVLHPAVFGVLEKTGPGSGGEIQLTDAMELLRNEGVPVHAIVYRGTRYDTGMPLGYLQTVVQIAVERDDLGAEFRKWLTEFVNNGDETVTSAILNGMRDTSGGAGT
jgi:UTP--glucose-1-phosphate uridylyltransferase